MWAIILALICYFNYFLLCSTSFLRITRLWILFGSCWLSYASGDYFVPRVSQYFYVAQITWMSWPYCFVCYQNWCSLTGNNRWLTTVWLVCLLISWNFLLISNVKINRVWFLFVAMWNLVLWILWRLILCVKKDKIDILCGKFCVILIWQSS